eukprot:TRINITY_DN955_c0_g1_i1.p1 TRINITY_DN955_c0_g1~~TRINITY_DN955_c0_g1_i1.p1  ORF type:complete len:254 (+),score=66.84 TRINITY_DN955_c0_g1_i1:108-869(+)
MIVEAHICPHCRRLFGQHELIIHVKQQHPNVLPTSPNSQLNSVVDDLINLSQEQKIKQRKDKSRTNVVIINKSSPASKKQPLSENHFNNQKNSGLSNQSTTILSTNKTVINGHEQVISQMYTREQERELKKLKAGKSKVFHMQKVNDSQRMSPIKKEPIGGLKGKPMRVLGSPTNFSPGSPDISSMNSTSSPNVSRHLNSPPSISRKKLFVSYESHTKNKPSIDFNFYENNSKNINLSADDILPDNGTLIETR